VCFGNELQHSVHASVTLPPASAELLTKTSFDSAIRSLLDMKVLVDSQ
jgi:hypothetical protein